MASKISAEAVKKRTGKVWSEWFKIINKAGGKKLSHKEIARWLFENFEVSSWWSQMITVHYENDIKGRKKYEKPDGFEISKTKTLPVPISKLYKAWSQKSIRSKWLADPDYKLRKAKVNQSLRISWVDGKTGINVSFYNKGKNKSMVSVQHVKLKSSREAERMKKYWERNLTNLKSFLIKNK